MQWPPGHRLYVTDEGMLHHREALSTLARQRTIHDNITRINYSFMNTYEEDTDSTKSS